MSLKASLIRQLKRFPIPFEWFRLARGAKPAADLNVKARPLLPSYSLPQIPITQLGLRRADSLHEKIIAPALSLYEYSGYVTHQGGFITENNFHIHELILYKDRGHPHDNSLRLFQKYKRIDAPVLALVEESSYNYYHWHVHACTLAIELIRSGILQSIPTPYFIYAPVNHFYQSHTLRELGFPPAQIIDSRTHQTIHSPHIIAINTPLHLTPAAIEHWQNIRHILVQSSRAAAGNAPRRIFVSRAHASRRRILNEEALWELIKPHGFTRVAFETLSYEDQRKIMLAATHLIMPHGAGGTNLLFAPPACRVLEIHNEQNIGDHYAALCAQLGHHYSYIICPQQPGTIGDIHVDLDLFAQVLPQWLSN